MVTLQAAHPDCCGGRRAGGVARDPRAPGLLCHLFLLYNLSTVPPVSFRHSLPTCLHEKNCGTATPGRQVLSVWRPTCLHCTLQVKASRKADANEADAAGNTPLGSLLEQCAAQNRDGSDRAAWNQLQVTTRERTGCMVGTNGR